LICPSVTTWLGTIVNGMGGYRFDNIAAVLDVIVDTAADMREK
jgi:hypothetical protein